MAAKDSKPRKIVGVSAAPSGKVSIDRKRWEKAMEDQERSDAILEDIGLDILLGGIIKGFFPQRYKDVRKLMDNPNMNMTIKGKLAYILELINKTVLNDLVKIHKIRNIFAHSFDARFADSEVLKVVQKLSTAKGEEVTEKNSIEFYISAGDKCLNHIMGVFDKQKLEQAQKG